MPGVQAMTGTGLAVQNSPAGTAAGLSLYAAYWVILTLGFLTHWLADRHRPAHGSHRTTELMLLWVVVLGGAWAIVAGLALIDGQSHQSAASIGYAPSMFQWEVGWADIAIGVLWAACARKALRGQWMTAAVTALAISFGGDAIGHIMQLSAHHNTDPANIWAIPHDILQGGLAVLLLVIYRRRGGPAPRPPRKLAEAGSANPP
jgi:uncharacterized membrane protein YsdA (DUF1294 family)